MIQIFCCDIKTYLDNLITRIKLKPFLKSFKFDTKWLLKNQMNP